jgi:hypothetical protein
VKHMVEKINESEVLVGKPEGMSLLERNLQ